jgi:hypothetical protein
MGRASEFGLEWLARATGDLPRSVPQWDDDYPNDADMQSEFSQGRAM